MTPVILRNRRWLGRCFIFLGIMGCLSPAQARIWVDSFTSAPYTYDQHQFPSGSALTLRLNSSPQPPASLQWLHDDQPIAQATGIALEIPDLSASDAGNYRVRITQDANVEYSETFTVNVLSAPHTVDESFTSRLPDGCHVWNATAFAPDGSFIANSYYVTNWVTSPTSPVRLASDGSVVANFHAPEGVGAVLAGFSDGRLITANTPYLLAADGSALAFVLPAQFDSTKALQCANSSTRAIIHDCSVSSLASQVSSKIRIFTRG